MEDYFCIFAAYYQNANLTATILVPSKPTDVQDNSILVEKDTARRYWFDAALTPTMSNDVYGSVSGWTTHAIQILQDTTNKGVTYTNVTENAGIGRALTVRIQNGYANLNLICQH